MKIPELVRDKVDKMVIETGKIEILGTHDEQTEGITDTSNGRKNKDKKRKIRICELSGACPFKNVWTHTDRCYASFSVWNTCLHKGEERKV